MLEPQARKLISEVLRPPDGYGLCRAIGTTFSLDLLALLAAPLSFAAFGWESAEEDDMPMDLAAMMEALREYADRITVFCQAGRIVVPAPEQPLYMHLEGSVVECAPQRGLFHPKVWLLRFVKAGEPVIYRFLCLSRNLTYDRCWDTAFALSGVLTDRKFAIASNHQLGDFIASLPGMASRALPDAIAADVDLMQREVRRVRWDPVPGVDNVVFHPIGAGRRTKPFDGRIDRMLVMAPFVGHKALPQFTAGGGGHVLVSRLEALDEIPTADLTRFSQVFTFDDAANLSSLVFDEDFIGDEILLEGLHAKLYVADAGRDARVWTGSANATDGAFHGNVEFLVELKGPKSKLGIDALLKKGEKGEVAFLDLLSPYALERERPQRDEVQDGLEAAVEGARERFGRLSLKASVRRTRIDDEYRLGLSCEGDDRTVVPEGVTVRCWPVRLSGGHARSVKSGQRTLGSFPVTTTTITSFFAFEVIAAQGKKQAVARFVRNVPLEGAPADRSEAILRAVLRDKAGVLRFLRFLLLDELDQPPGGWLGANNGDDSRVGSWSAADIPVLEALLRAISRDPKRLGRVARLIDDLHESPELVPDGFARIWEPIKAAWETLPEP